MVEGVSQIGFKLLGESAMDEALKVGSDENVRPEKRDREAWRDEENTPQDGTNFFAKSVNVEI